MSGSVPLIAGVDGCPSGWVAAVGPAAGGEPWLTIAPSFAALVGMHPRVKCWAVDIPIGLAGNKSRLCDSLARQRLGPRRGASVFPAPPLVVSQYSDKRGESADYTEACRLAAEATGKKISKQAWNITPKIAEVRSFLIETPKLRDRVVESHPELCFARLAEGKALADGKKTSAGGLRRRHLLSRVFGAPCVERLVIQTASTRGVGVDDTLDALACWTAAARVATGQADSLPLDPSLDADGLRVAIVW